MKLAIGSAQFGLDYGVSNNTGKVPNQEVNKILNVAKKSGINFLDTAIAYGNSESSLGLSNVSKFNIISKLSSLGKGNKNIKEEIFQQINGSLDRLGVNSLYGVLLHDTKILLTDNGDQIYEALLGLKQEGLVKKVGISIYDTIELDEILSKFKIDIVQAPMNIFDQRLISSGWNIKLEKMGIELHVRSVFLQGLLLMKPSERPEYFKPWKSLLEKYDGWLIESGYTNIEACINSILQIDSVNKVIIGIESSKQLEEIITLIDKKLIKIPVSLSSKDTSLIDPTMWKI
jgi:aryl-alcohol dehydrogenase-like predicted oxidoreductase